MAFIAATCFIGTAGKKFAPPIPDYQNNQLWNFEMGAYVFRENPQPKGQERTGQMPRSEGEKATEVPRVFGRGAAVYS
jgi:hypothetical protein